MQISIIFILFLVMCSSQTQAFQSFEDFEKEQKQKTKEATIANNNMSDEELLLFLQRMFKYMPEEFEALASQDSKKLKKSLNNFRDFYSISGLKVSDLINYFDENPEMEEWMAQTWYEDTVVYEYAELTLSGLPNEQYKSIISSCIKLIESGGESHLTENFPDTLSFIEIQNIKLEPDYCEIYLYRGIGSYKRAGFIVTKSAEGEFKLEKFNYTKSLEHEVIDVIQ